MCIYYLGFQRFWQAVYLFLKTVLILLVLHTVFVTAYMVRTVTQYLATLWFPPDWSGQKSGIFDAYTQTAHKLVFPVDKSRHQELSAYCPNIYTVPKFCLIFWHSSVLKSSLPSNSDKVAGSTAFYKKWKIFNILLILIKLGPRNQLGRLGYVPTIFFFGKSCTFYCFDFGIFF